MEKLSRFLKENIYINLFLCFFKVGIVTIGGGIVMIPLLQEKICDQYKWLSQEEMLDCIALSQGLPGVVAINMATYVGYFKKGIPGAIMATLGVILPSFIIIIMVVLFLEEVGTNPYIGGALEGIKAASTGLIAYAGWKMGQAVLRNPFQWAVAIIAFVAIIVLGISAVWVIAAGIVAGGIYRVSKDRKEAKRHEHSS